MVPKKRRPLLVNLSLAAVFAALLLAVYILAWADSFRWASKGYISPETHLTLHNTVFYPIETWWERDWPGAGVLERVYYWWLNSWWRGE
jgi:hypothetical protein